MSCMVIFHSLSSFETISSCFLFVAIRVSVLMSSLELRINTPKLEIPLILGGTGQRFRACGGEGAPLAI